MRLMRPRSPCCIPRLKRTMATFGDGYCYIFRYKIPDLSGKAKLTNSISTGTLRTHNQGMTILIERLSATKVRTLGHTYNVVMPTTNQKSCWRKMCFAVACQDRVSVLYESPRMVKTPEKYPLAPKVPAAINSAHR